MPNPPPNHPPVLPGTSENDPVNPLELFIRVSNSNSDNVRATVTKFRKPTLVDIVTALASSEAVVEAVAIALTEGVSDICPMTDPEMPAATPRPSELKQDATGSGAGGPPAGARTAFFSSGRGPICGYSWRGKACEEPDNCPKRHPAFCENNGCIPHPNSSCTFFHPRDGRYSRGEGNGRGGKGKAPKNKNVPTKNSNASGNNSGENGKKGNGFVELLRMRARLAELELREERRRRTKPRTVPTPPPRGTSCASYASVTANTLTAPATPPTPLMPPTPPAYRAPPAAFPAAPVPTVSAPTQPVELSPAVLAAIVHAVTEAMARRPSS